MFKVVNKSLKQLPCHVILAISTAIVFFIGFLDFITGNELAFSVFYTLPVAISAWYCRRYQGVFIALLASILWLVADISIENRYSSGWIQYWNITIRFSMFLIVGMLVSTVRKMLLAEESIADKDELTQLFNRHAFTERLNLELERFKRYKAPFTLAFIDLDNFKFVNDTFGHHVGDEVLIEVSLTLNEHIRLTDIPARLGGDEFVVLVINTKYEDASSLLHKLHNSLTDSMKKMDWPVTFSIGAITVDSPCDNSHELLKKADELMYTVKKSGKSALRHQQWQ